MPSLEVILPHALPFTAVLARMAGIFIFAPVLGSLAIPIKIKVLLVVAMALVVYPTIDHGASAHVSVTIIDLAGIALGETMVGFVIGLIASLPILSVQMAGLLMGQQMGLGLANVFNPAVDTEADIIGQMLLYAAMAAFLAFDGLEAMHMALVESFAHAPLGAVVAAEAPLDLIIGLLQAGFELALRVAAPVVCVLFLETIAAGLIMKTVPQINILSFGFPIKILMGIFVLIAALNVIDEAVAVDVAEAITSALRWVRTL